MWKLHVEGDSIVIRCTETNKIIEQFESYRPLKSVDYILDQYMRTDFRQCIRQELSKGICYKAAENKAKATIIGCGPSKFVKALNALMYKKYVAHIHQKHIRTFAITHFKKGADSINRRVINILNKDKETKALLDLALEDNTYNIAPFILLKGMSTSQLKQYYGKGLWKHLCANSLSRNKLIVDHILVNGILVQGNFSSMKCGEEERDIVSTLNSLPSALLLFAKKSPTYALPYIKWAGDNMKGHWGQKRTISYIINIVRDTQRMAEQLDMPFSLSWGKKRMEETHHHYSSLLTQRTYGKEKFPYVGTFPDIVCSEEHEGWEAVLLSSPYELYMEGTKQRHCVASYASSCMDNKYAVYSIRQHGKQYSTVGIDITGEPFIHQHFCVCNGPVKEQAAFALASLVINMLVSQACPEHA